MISEKDLKEMEEERANGRLITEERTADLLAEIKRLRKREATFDAFIDSLDVHKEHEWMLIERIDEIHERLHGGEKE